MPKTTGRSRLKLILVLLAMTPFLILVIAILTMVLLSFRVTAELDRLRESIRRDGYPITVEELSDWYSPGRGSLDAGLAFTELSDRYKPELEDKEELLVFDIHPDIQEPLTDAQVGLATRHLRNNTDYLHDLHRLVDEYESVRYPVDVTEGFKMDSSVIVSIRNKTRMMALEALVAANAGYKAKTTDALVGAFRVAETLRHEPMVISQMVRVACLKIAFDASEQAINRIYLTAAELEKLRTALDAIDCDKIMQFGLVGERCFWDWAVQRYGFPLLHDETSPSPFWALLMKIPGSGRYMDWELLHATEMYTELIAVGNSEPSERKELARSVQQELNENLGLGNSIANKLIPSMIRAFEAESRILAYLDALSVGLAALQFSSDHERMPNELQELVPGYLPEVPTDPFSGNPLRMRSDETGIVIYSLGHDRDDDGGNPSPEGKSLLEDGDIVFRVLR